MKRIDITVTGGCQCGAVRYRATAMLDNAHLCHCRMCQKATGGLFSALVAAPNDALEWTRGTPAAFRSSDHVDRGFCAACGAPLTYRDLQGKHTNLTIGSLDDPAAFPPRRQMGSESRLPWFDSLPTLEDIGATEDQDADWATAIASSNNQAPDRD
ncbi:GFA family protein [Sphingomonas sp. ST-64]|uniref:GFA family protein n=1 Tax=Sphingomonas plantiphila TaxID=3163295 RepID=A0ABW8YRK0_9SPHN